MILSVQEGSKIKFLEDYHRNERVKISVVAEMAVWHEFLTKFFGKVFQKEFEEPKSHRHRQN